jgi:hypothetical protein
MTKKTKEANIVTVDAKKLTSFLSKIHLGGLLNECILQSNEEFVSASSIDPSNIIFLSIQDDIDISPLGNLGIGDIGIIYKFVGDCPTDELTLVRKDNRIVIVHSGIRIEYLLTDRSLITTSVEDGKLEDIVKKCEYSFTLTKYIKDAFLSAINTLKVKTVSIVVDNGLVVLTGGLSHEHTFKLHDPIPLEDGSITESFMCSFYADYIKAVFSVLDFKENEEPIIIFSPDYPMVVQEDSNSWVVFPLTLD